MFNVRWVRALLLFACLVPCLFGCGDRNRQASLAVLNDADHQIASLSKDIEGVCDRLRDLLTQSSKTMSDESVVEYRTLLPRLEELQAQREGHRMIGASSELVSLAATSRQLQDAIQQTADPSRRDVLVAERKAAEESLKRAIEQVGMTDAKHAIANESDSAVRLAYKTAMGIHFFLADAVADSEKALDRRVKGAIASYNTFKGMQVSFRECLTSLGRAAAMVDVNERNAAVVDAARQLEDTASKKDEIQKECRLLRLSS